MIEHRTNINGISVTAGYTPKAVDEIFLPLLQMLTEKQHAEKRRILVMLAAPPGAGKSTLLSFLERLSRERTDICDIQAIGMDGFHRRQEDLLSHFTIRNGERIPMVKIKGAPETFDLEKLTEGVKRVASGADCRWPVYDRTLHNPVEDALNIGRNIVLLEGNYLLLDADGWRELRSYADYTISITAEEMFLRSRLIDRRILTGVDREEAVRFVDYSDMPNVRLCLGKMMAADLRLRVDAEGDYHIEESS